MCFRPTEGVLNLYSKRRGNLACLFTVNAEDQFPCNSGSFFVGVEWSSDGMSFAKYYKIKAEGR